MKQCIHCFISVVVAVQPCNKDCHMEWEYFVSFVYLFVIFQILMNVFQGEKAGSMLCLALKIPILVYIIKSMSYLGEERV